jgi:hypothetical protein
MCHRWQTPGGEIHILSLTFISIARKSINPGQKFKPFKE